MQTGSVALASPVSKNAWQRHPPKSSARRSQLRHGSGIHCSPRKRWKAADSRHIHSSECSRTLSKLIPRNHARRMARKRLPGRINQKQPPSPSAHARFGIACIIIGHHAINSHLAGKTRLSAFHNTQAVFQLFAALASTYPDSSKPNRNIAHAQFPADPA